MRWRAGLTLVLVVGLGLAPACSDDGEADERDEGDARGGEVEDSFLDFTRCMRDRGVDIPEATPDDLTIVDPSPEVEAEYPGYGEAFEACIPIVEEVTGSFEMSAEEIAEFQDVTLATARCMRDKGYDYPDPQFGDDGMPVPDEALADQPPDQIDVYVDDLNDCGDQATGADGSDGG